jgi:hypothetical protein
LFAPAEFSGWIIREDLHLYKPSAGTGDRHEPAIGGRMPFSLKLFEGAAFHRVV